MGGIRLVTEISWIRGLQYVGYLIYLLGTFVSKNCILWHNEAESAVK